jgi:glucose dehydrogenase
MRFPIVLGTFASLLLPLAVRAQPAPAPFCVSPALAQTLAAALQQSAAVLAMLNDAAQEPARTAAAIAAAKAEQKKEDETHPATPAPVTGAVKP